MTKPRAGRPKLRAALLVVIAALLAAALALSVSSDDDAPRSDGPALTGEQALLSGKVIDAKTKAALPGAKLVIDQEGGRLTVIADAKGNFRTVINASRSIGFTADAPAHQGTVGFGMICPGERRSLTLSLPPAGARSAPPAPLVLGEEKCG